MALDQGTPVARFAWEQVAREPRAQSWREVRFDLDIESRACRADRMHGTYLKSGPSVRPGVEPHHGGKDSLDVGLTRYPISASARIAARTSRTKFRSMVATPGRLRKSGRTPSQRLWPAIAHSDRGARPEGSAPGRRPDRGLSQVLQCQRFDSLVSSASPRL